MPDLEFIKLKTYMFDDEKIRIIESMPDADSLIVIWVKLLCQAGKTYAGGYICLNESVPFTEEELAAVLGRPINTVRLAIQTFKRLGMIELNHDGILLLNFAKHQNIVAIEAAKEKNRQKVARYRAKLKMLPLGYKSGDDGNGNVTVTLPNVTEQIIDIRDKKEDRRKKIEDTPYSPPISVQSPSPLNNFLLFEKNISHLTPLIEQELLKLEKGYPALWVRDAIREAVRQNQRNMSYIKGILRNWGKEGHDVKNV